MEKNKLGLEGCYIFDIEHKTNKVFGNVFYNYSDFVNLGLKKVFSQHYEIIMQKANVLRGFYIQDEPIVQEHLMRCSSGSFEVTLLDVRENSETYLQHVSIVLNHEKPTFLYFTKGIAYAIRSLENDSLMYCMTDNLVDERMNVTINAFDKKINCIWPDDVAMSILGRSAPTIDELKHNYW